MVMKLDAKGGAENVPVPTASGYPAPAASVDPLSKMKGPGVGEILARDMEPLPSMWNAATVAQRNQKAFSCGTRVIVETAGDHGSKA